MDAIMPNLTFVYQLILFFAALFVIQKFIIKPITEVLRGRSERIEGAEREAARLDGESDEMDGLFRGKIRDARAQAKLDRAKRRETALAEEKEILRKGRDEAQIKLQAIVGEIQRESGEAREKLRADAAQLSRLFAEKLLGRPVS